MGVILAGRHLQLDQKVAIKVLRKAVIGDPESTARFSREARAAAKIRSEHVARVLDVGTLDDGAPYMVMEFLHGSDLSQLVKANGPLAPEQAVDYVLQACEALAEAHAARIVHRDLKPANLFLAKQPDGTSIVKVLDFGISKFLPQGESGVDGDTLTKTAVMMGSPHYMSPEQLKSARDVDARADVWSLGAVLFRLMSGKTPFAAETTAELCAEILLAKPKSLHAENALVSSELEAIVEKCLAKDRGDRYASIADLAMALKPFASEPARESVERIAATLSAPRFSSIPPAAGGDAKEPTATTATDVAIPNAADPHDTLTTNAASVSARPVEPTPAAKAVTQPGRPTRWKPALAIAAVVASLAVVAYAVPRSKADEGGVTATTSPPPQPPASIGERAPVPPPPESVAPVEATAAPSASVRSAAAPIRRATSTAPGATTAKTVAVAAAPVTAPPATTTPPAAAQPTATGGGLTGFGDRK